MGAATDEMMVEYAEEGEEGFDSDSEAFACVRDVLDSVRMARAPNLVDSQGKNAYVFILSLLDPTVRFRENKDEALLAPLLNALTQAVLRIDPTYHGSLLSNVFAMRTWFLRNYTRTALLDLIATLAAVPDKFLEGCLHMLVSNFVPPESVLRDEAKLVIMKRENHHELHACLQRIFRCVPLAPLKLSDIFIRTMPRLSDSKAKLIAFVECVLGLSREDIGDVLGATLLSKVINMLSDLDVNITWNDILQEDQTIGIFDMELEDFEDHFLQFVVDDIKIDAPFNVRGFNSNNNSTFMEKLDGLMVVVFEHLNSRFKSGYLSTDYGIFMDIFRTSVLKLHKSKFTQFVMFYACSLDENWSQMFAFDLAEVFHSTSEDPISRMSAISYLASYLSRAKFISSSVIVTILIRLVDWCLDYCKVDQERISNVGAHQIYYSACQAVMYILCFRMRQLLDVPSKGTTKSFLFDLPLGSILLNGFDPLKVCLSSVVQEFLQQAKAARLFHAAVTSIDENAIDSELSKAFGGTQRLDIFFPFDPYLLKESDRFIRRNFVYWSMVKTTYSNCNSEEDEGEEDEEDEELEDLDAPRISSGPVGSFEDHYDEYSDCDEEDDVPERSLNNMSVTHKQTLYLHMPPKIQPSVSPPV